ncbi:MAG: DUF4112 domain-containing protein [Haloarculaceae archaeon]
MTDADRDGAAPRDEPALRRARTASRLLDDAVRVPGIGVRVGLDPLLSAAPSPVGDVVGAVLSLYVVHQARRLGVPRPTLARMLVNVGVDAAGGSIPVAGVLFDAVWKANERNLALLERHLHAVADE